LEFVPRLVLPRLLCAPPLELVVPVRVEVVTDMAVFLSVLRLGLLRGGEGRREVFPALLPS
jgi:hypothetical protein